MDYRLDKLQKIINIVKLSSKKNFRHSADIDLSIDCREMALFEINHLIGAGIKFLDVGTDFNLEMRKKIVNPVKYRLIENMDEDEIGRIYDDYDLVEGISDLETIKNMAVYGLKIGKIVSVLIKVDIIGKSGKYGIFPKNLMDFLKGCSAYSAIKVRGIMVDFPPFNNEYDAKKSYIKLAGLLKVLRLRYKNLKVLSTNIHEISEVEFAVENGVTEIRIPKNILEKD